MFAVKRFLSGNVLKWKELSQKQNVQTFIKKVLKSYIERCKTVKGGFFSESAIRFSNLQISKKLSRTWNLKFPPIK